MKSIRKKQLPIFLSMLFVLSGTIPSYAEVATLTTDNSFYVEGDQIRFSGTVEENSKGLVTIVIKDPNEKFVMLTQAMINPDNTFEKIVNTNTKFSNIGMYNATAFIFKITSGAMSLFEFSTQPQTSEDKIPETVDVIIPEEHVITNDGFDEKINSQQDIDKSKIADFIDPTKQSQYYVDRYNNEPEYKEWFDRNYPHLTIEDAVGHNLSQIGNQLDEITVINEAVIKDSISEIINQEIVPEVSALSIVEQTELSSQFNSEFGKIGLALGGLALLFGAVYGIKRKVDSNSEQISHNWRTIKKKTLHDILHNDPFDIIKGRLAHGEISIKEYNKLKDALKI